MDLYKSHRNTYFQTIRASKEQHWHSFLVEAQGKDIFTALRYTRYRIVERTPTLLSPGDPEPATTSSIEFIYYSGMFTAPRLVWSP